MSPTPYIPTTRGRLHSIRTRSRRQWTSNSRTAPRPRTQLAVYELKGDTLIVCIEKKEKGYPKAVASKEGNMFLTLKRVKAEDKPKSDPASQKADLDATKSLASACEVYKLNNGDWPTSLEALANNQPKGWKANPFSPGYSRRRVRKKFNIRPQGSE